MNLLHRKPKRAAVLGCGPAGLFATHALKSAGWEVDILSNKRRSEMFGAQYLHAPIPGLDSIHTTLRYELRGSIEEYRQKVYGEAPVDAVSPESLVGQHEVWDIRAAYFDAWTRYGHEIIHTPGIGAADVRNLLNSNKYRFIVSSLPAKDICEGVHRFSTSQVWTIGDAPERGTFCPVPTPPNRVICDGTRDVGWYRSSNVFGYNTCEWPAARKPPISEVASVIKPIRTDCDCWGGRVIRVGRYGTWTKGVLSHEAYNAMEKVI